ncbi:MAG: ABC transporter ATP-binding protein [Treponema sp.]|nr:ABC transporter ATP-binding protein [Treponema sp.]
MDSQKTGVIMNKLELKNVSFSFGDEKAVKNVSLAVEEGSFTTLLGPSGCGKTTLLRLISGFLEPLSGQVLIDGSDQKGIEVNERKVGMVFQDYALFPHLSVMQNIIYGLKIQKKKIGKDLMESMAFDTARSLGIEDLLSRFPHELSGGQQQRVALGRSLILEPKLLLMDEPLSSLDTKLRMKVREELKEIQQKLKITTVYVTHDQDEALSLSTKIAVLNKGELLQEGSPREIYFEPKSEFVADFAGKANFIRKNGKVLMIRPEWFVPIENPEIWKNEIVPQDKILISGIITKQEFLGGKTRFTVQAENEKIIADFDTIKCENIRSGSKIFLLALRFWQL